MSELFKCLVIRGLKNSLIMRCYSKDKKVSRLKRIFPKKKPMYEPNLGVRHVLDTLTNDRDPVVDIKPQDLDFDADGSDEIVFNAGRTYRQYEHENEFRRNRMMMKIVKRKYFKDVPEPCFLTYAAKEQLRYLRDSDPETWTCDKLAESFPITITGVKKLLKHKPSAYVTDEDILNHDKKVFQNWKMLKPGKGGPISSAVSQKLLESLNIEAITGNKSLPVPTDNWRRQNLYLPSTKSLTEKPVGEFESMIIDYKQLSKGKTENQHLEEQNKRAIKDAQQEALHQVALTSSNITSQQKKLNSTFEEFKEKLKKELSNSSLESELRKMQKIEKKQIPKLNETEIENDESKYDDILKYFDGKIQKTVGIEMPNLRWDTPRGAKSDQIKEAYIYDSDLGYQRPFGRHENIDKITLKHTNKNGVYQKGDCFYDDDGNFLFRTSNSNIPSE